MKARMTSPQSIDDYLASLSVEKRAALQYVRRAIKAAAPQAVECISYGIPAFRLDGRVLVYLGAAAKHCALYPGAHPIEAHKKALAAYDTSKGTVRFPPDAPLPAALVRTLVRTRIAEQSARRAASKRRPARGR